MKSWIEISRERLAANYRASRAVAEREAGSAGMSLLAVVKANAYGHGAALCAPVLAAAGTEWLGVTDAAEGATVRDALAQAGLDPAHQPAVLVMCGHPPEDAPLIARHRLTAVAWHPRHLEPLARAATTEPLRVHLEIDTGMSRQGVAVGPALEQFLRAIVAEPRLRLDGLMTHFAAAEVAGSPQTATQRERFERAVESVARAGLRPAWVHAGNTSTIDNADGGTLAWLAGLATRLGARALVREGLGLYGHCLPLAGLVASDGEGASRLRAAVHPVMTWKTRLIGIEEVPAGALVGYNGTFAAPYAMRLGLLPVGYADGLRRELSSTDSRRGGWVMVHGRRAPIAGRVSMNLTTVDLSGIPGATVGDEVVLLGESITAEDHAALAGTIPYEILCGVRAPILPVRAHLRPH